MTNRNKVNSKVTKMLNKLLPTASQHHVGVLSMMVVGIVLGKQAQLSQMSLQIPRQAKPASLEKQFHRFVKNNRVDVERFYLPFAEHILAHLGNRISVVMDASQVGRGCMVLMVAVLYKNRAIPLVWIVYKGKKGHASAERHLDVLALLETIIPAETEVILLGDGEYDTIKMLNWVETVENWAYIVRSRSDSRITHDNIEYAFKDLALGKGTKKGLYNALFTKDVDAPFVTAIAWWDEPYENPIFLVSNSKKMVGEICDLYAQRYKIETIFSDQKSRGFNIHKSHLRHPERVNRLLLATSIAYLWMIFLGVEIANDNDRRQIIDRPDRTDKSLFRLGLDWFIYSMTRELDIKILFAPPNQPILEGVR